MGKRRPNNKRRTRKHRSGGVNTPPSSTKKKMTGNTGKKLKYSDHLKKVIVPLGVAAAASLTGLGVHHKMNPPRSPMHWAHPETLPFQPPKTHPGKDFLCEYPPPCPNDTPFPYEFDNWMRPVYPGCEHLPVCTNPFEPAPPLDRRPLVGICGKDPHDLYSQHMSYEPGAQYTMRQNCPKEWNTHMMPVYGPLGKSQASKVWPLQQPKKGTHKGKKGKKGKKGAKCKNDTRKGNRGKR